MYSQSCIYVLEIDKNPGALDPASTNSLSTESENPKQEVNEAPSSSDVQDVVAPSPIPTGKMDKVEIPTPVQSSDKVVATEGDAAVASSPQNGAFFPASITSWFYGTSINDASKTSNTPPRSVKSTTSDVIETGSISSEPSTISESKSNSANKRAPDKIAARLEALRKKNLK